MTGEGDDPFQGLERGYSRHLDALARRALAAAAIEQTGDPGLIASMPKPAATEARIEPDDADRFETWLAGLPRRQDSIDGDGLASLMAFVTLQPVANADRQFHLEHLRPSTPLAQAIGTGASRILIIGGGMSGILAAIRLQAAGFDFLIVEQSDDLGGTWHDNVYPGCRVDVPSQSYSYSFHANPGWTQHFCRQPELAAYFRNCAAQYGIEEKCRLSARVERLAFDAPSGEWLAAIRSSEGTLEIMRFRAVISAVGQLNRPRIPSIQGLAEFPGASFHSARWNRDVDLAGKRVAIVGTGASATQFAPEVARQAGRTVIFQSSAPWLMPTPDYHEDIAEAQRQLLGRFPSYLAWYRYALFVTTADSLMPFTRVDPDWQDKSSVSDANRQLKGRLERYLVDQAGDRPDLLRLVTPDYPPGAKRLLRDNGSWFDMLRRSDVHLEANRVTAIEGNALVAESGARHEADVIIFGTGFEATAPLDAIEITGIGGADLAARWNGDPSAYLGISVPDFPNFFLLYGPNTNIVANGSIIAFSEYAMTYIVDALQYLDRQDLASLDVEPESLAGFLQEMDEANASMAWGLADIESWYKSRSGRVSQNWPLRVCDYWNRTRRFDPAKYRLTERSMT